MQLYAGPGFPSERIVNPHSSVGPACSCMRVREKRQSAIQCGLRCPGQPCQKLFILFPTASPFGQMWVAFCTSDPEIGSCGAQNGAGRGGLAGAPKSTRRPPSRASDRHGCFWRVWCRALVPPPACLAAAQSPPTRPAGIGRLPPAREGPWHAAARRAAPLWVEGTSYRFTRGPWRAAARPAASCARPAVRRTAAPQPGTGAAAARPLPPRAARPAASCARPAASCARPAVRRTAAPQPGTGAAAAAPCPHAPPAPGRFAHPPPAYRTRGRCVCAFGASRRRRRPSSPATTTSAGDDDDAAAATTTAAGDDDAALPAAGRDYSYGVPGQHHGACRRLPAL